MSMSSDDFELVDPAEVAKDIAADKKPDIAKINAWLSPTDYDSTSSSEFRRHLASQAPGTGQWIRDTAQFQQWHSSNDHGSIWIKAVPGAGKSVVAASMVNSLSREESVPVLFFFFRQIIEANRTARSLLRDWMAQLLPFSEMLQVSLWEHVEDNKRDLDSVSTEEMWKLLLASLRLVERAYCVVDALDEMDVDEEFLSRLNLLGLFRPAQLKVLLTSRPKQYLQRALRDPQVIDVSLEEELVKRDIAAFVQHRTSEFGSSVFTQDILKFIQDTVYQRSQGLFLYARLMLDQIALICTGKPPTEASLRQMVAQLPVGLEEMYNRVLLDHAAQVPVEQDTQVLILKVVAHSARPLRLIEIAKAVEIMTPDCT
jgi:arsenate reductase-like glutaredoxin family protein